MDDQVGHGRGPSSFVIHGELHHQICALTPNHEQHASYAQLYIYNPDTTLNLLIPVIRKTYVLIYMSRAVSFVRTSNFLRNLIQFF
ncbi:hypothetical protein GIB67_034774 [Kingdonia uniflora]|uniref:Uncharacterized protein n=1 Tax=Kingdonia uniflora TaxID=39325 RepID=A0A7J7ME19_9MAGN|nr:hypothetical protein GIB67_034774 [Kingdonia uniflora]